MATRRISKKTVDIYKIYRGANADTDNYLVIATIYDMERARTFVANTNNTKK